MGPSCRLCFFDVLFAKATTADTTTDIAECANIDYYDMELVTRTFRPGSMGVSLVRGRPYFVISTQGGAGPARAAEDT